MEAIRFPSGTFVRSVELAGSTAVVDLNANVKNTGGGSLTETGMFKSLVWTLTGLHGVNEVQIKVDGARVATLPDGHLELDEPLKRSSW